MNASFAKGIATSLLALAAIGAANATIYVGRWDPQYGAPFTTTNVPPFAFDLGWRGKGFFDVPNGCTPVPGGFQIVNAAGCGATALSAYVQFYDIANQAATLEQIDWGGASPNVVGGLNDLLYNNGALIGFSTSSSQPVVDPNGYQNPGDSAVVSWSLAFTFDSLNPPGYNGPTLRWSTDVCDGDFCNHGFADVARFPPDFKVEVPEPGSAALAAVALLGAGWIGRRRRTAATAA